MQFIIMMLALGGMMYFMTRNQKKQQQERQNLLDSVKPGDAVVTIGGLHGIVAEVRKESNKNTLLLDCEGIFLEFDRSSIKTVVPGVGVVETVEDVVESIEDTIVEEPTEVIEEEVTVVEPTNEVDEDTIK